MTSLARIYYTQDHEWISLADGVATVGITDHAQEQLGELVFIELPQSGATFSRGDVAVTVESVKAASEVYAPVDGVVTEVNAGLADNPALINSSPLGEGWMWKMTLADDSQLEGLMDEAAYAAHVA
jgi:glycine cleavage system H protein